MGFNYISMTFFTRETIFIQLEISFVHRYLMKHHQPHDVFKQHNCIK